MKLHTTSPRRTGFTLIELLVVIAIIAVLAALGFGAGATAINNAKKLTAKNECTNLVHAVNGYFDEYSHFPDVGDGSTGDVDSLTDSTIMNVLMGIGTGEDQNPKKIRFYQGNDAKGAEGREYGGLLRTSTNADLFDTWRKINSGAIRRYQILWDGNYDDELVNPFGPKPIYKTVVAWSTGKDGEEVRDSETNAKNRDNVYSWK
jgi:prepilin-type N-terminal cleavage/methylation domain-containing protein